ncbi:MAG: alpha/beta hydrolase [Planctomycetes bacterium]|nr:alpha/beta hydrolase [Planctomycetota bacterium]
MLLATLSLCLLAAAPQEPLLKPADQQKIAQKLGEYIDAKIANDAKKQEKAIDAFRKEFDKLGKKLNNGLGLLSSPVDLEAILQGAGTWAKGEAGPGKVSTGKSEAQPAWVSWSFWAPKTYDPKDLTHPVVLWVLPIGTNPRQWLTDLSTASPLAETHAMAAIALPKPEEGDATKAVMIALRGALTVFRADHNRVVLGSEGASCGLAMELANRFPHRFAGIVFSSPAGAPPECRNLSGVPCFVGGNAAEWSKALGDAKAAVVSGETDAGKVAEWVGAQKRSPYPTSINFYPAHNSSRQSYWVRVVPEWSIGANNQILLDADKRPSVEVKVERDKNRITAQVARVERIEFLLNDTIVDLEKPITIEVNGKVTEVQKKRDLAFVIDQFERSGDRGCAFCASFLLSEIPKSESEKAAGEPAKGDAADGAKKKG